MKLAEKIWMFAAAAIVTTATVIADSPPLVIAGTLVGILYVVLVAAKHWTANIFGALLALIFGYLSYTVGYYANAAVNMLILAPMSVYGVFKWKSEADLPPRELSTPDKLSVAAVMALVIGVVYFATAAGGSNLPVLDSITGVLPVAATILLVTRFKDQWLLWVPYNALEVFMWFTAASLVPEVMAIFVMRCVFFVNSLYGACNWYKN